MSTIAMNYIVNPLSGFWHSLVITLEIIGYSRAAAELSRLGLHKEAQRCKTMIKKLR